MIKYMMIFTIVSVLSLQSESCPICLSQDLQHENDEHNEAMIRGQKCKCFCSLTVTENATVSNNLTVDGDITAGSITAPGGTVDGQLFVEGNSVDAIFNVSQYFFIPNEPTRIPCATSSQTVRDQSAIAFPTSIVSGSGSFFFGQINSTTFGTKNYPSGGNLIFNATIQFEPLAGGGQIKVQQITAPQYGSVPSTLATVTIPAGASQITITGTAGPLLGTLQFINYTYPKICITSANVKFVSSYFKNVIHQQ